MKISQYIFNRQVDINVFRSRMASTTEHPLCFSISNVISIVEKRTGLHQGHQFKNSDESGKPTIHVIDFNQGALPPIPMASSNEDGETSSDEEDRYRPRYHVDRSTYTQVHLTDNFIGRCP